MEVTDYTVSNTYTETIYISAGAASGNRVIAGISEATHVAFFVPCFDAGAFAPIAGFVEPRMPRTYISGSVVYWNGIANEQNWYNGYYTLRVVRIQ
jgi:hypothetical protein